MSGDESVSEDTGEDESDWDDSEGSEGTSDSDDDVSEVEETGNDKDKLVTGEKRHQFCPNCPLETVSHDLVFNLHFVFVGRKLPHTPPGTPPDTPPATPPLSRTPSNASVTPTASPVDVTTMEDIWKSDVDNEGYKLTIQDKEGTLESPKDRTPHSMTSQDAVLKQEGEGTLVNEGGDEVLSEASSIIPAQKHIAHKVAYTSEDSTADSQHMKSPLLKTGGEELSVTKETPVEPTYEPVVELPLEFPVRSYWQDDSLVYNFLVSGLDYEDASYLKIGFENLQQVGSDSVANAHWSFHPSILSFCSS